MYTPSLPEQKALYHTLPTHLTLWGIGLAAVAGSAPLWGFSPLVVAGGVIATGMAVLFASAPWLALLVTLFVMLLPPGLLPFDLQSILVGILLLTSLVFWLLQTAFQRRPIVWALPLLFLGAFYLWAFISLLWANDLVVSRRELVQYALVILPTFLLVNGITSRRILDGFMVTLALSGWVLIASGLWTLMVEGYTRGERLQIFAMNENMLSTQLVLMIPGVVWPVILATGWRRQQLMLLSLLYLALALILTALSGSRGGMIALVTLLVAFGCTQWTRAWARWSLILVVVLLISTPTLFAASTERFLQPAEDGSLGSRDLLWHAGLLLIADHWWSGVGIGNGSYEMPAYISAITETDHLDARDQLAAHNPIIEVGTDLGVPGVFLYLGAFCSAAWLLLRTYRRAGRAGQETLLAYCALIACLTVAFLTTWMKSGGVDSHITTFLLLALLIIPGRLQDLSMAHRTFFVKEAV